MEGEAKETELQAACSIEIVNYKIHSVSLPYKQRLFLNDCSKGLFIVTFQMLFIFTFIFISN